MRLWHKDMIKYLPSQQLISQWRELCCIGVLLAKNHTPNHILVNKILDYPPDHFEQYCNMVVKEMTNRGFNINETSYHTLQNNVRAWRVFLGEELPYDQISKDWELAISEPDLFESWHDDRYLKQCYYNLEEKYDCGGIPGREWMIIFANFGGGK